MFDFFQNFEKCDLFSKKYSFAFTSSHQNGAPQNDTTINLGTDTKFELIIITSIKYSII